MMYKIKYSYPNSRSLTIIKETIHEVCEALPKYMEDCGRSAYRVEIEVVEE